MLNFNSNSKSKRDFYNSTKWKNKRERILKRDGYVCQNCKRFGKTVEATAVHHIQHYETNPELGLVDSNLISLCNKCHNEAHPERAARGRKGTKAMITLVVGMPGSGKTTYVQQRLGAEGLCYDLDYLAAAVRLTAPHKENNKAAWQMMNDLLGGFCRNAEKYSNNVFIIRTAPTISELETIKPSRVVLMDKVYRPLPRDFSEEKFNNKIADLVFWCRQKKIKVSPPCLAGDFGAWV